jgi:hypothetical protein
MTTKRRTKVVISFDEIRMPARAGNAHVIGKECLQEWIAGMFWLLNMEGEWTTDDNKA